MDDHLGLDRGPVASDVDDQLLAFHPVRGVFAVGFDRHQFELVAVEPKRTVVIPVADHLERRPDARPLGIQVEIEPKLGNEPVRRLIIFPSYRHMGR